MKILEFANENEAIEYIADNNLEHSSIEYSEYGVAVKVLDSEDLIEEHNKNKADKCIIYSPLKAESKLYLYKSGLPRTYGYEQMFARVFNSLKDAQKVAAIMSKNGKRRWLVEKLVSRY